MLDSKSTKRIASLPRPFPLSGYHYIFDKVGAHELPNNVTEKIVFITRVYLEDFAELDLVMPNGWREKNLPRKDAYLLLSSVSKEAVQVQDPNSKRRKMYYRSGDIPFTAIYDVGSSTITIKYSYHKYLNQDKGKDCPIPQW